MAQVEVARRLVLQAHADAVREAAIQPRRRVVRSPRNAGDARDLLLQARESGEHALDLHHRDIATDTQQHHVHDHLAGPPGCEVREDSAPHSPVQTTARSAEKRGRTRSPGRAAWPRATSACTWVPAQATSRTLAGPRSSTTSTTPSLAPPSSTTCSGRTPIVARPAGPCAGQSGVPSSATQASPARLARIAFIGGVPSWRATSAETRRRETSSGLPVC